MEGRPHMTRECRYDVGNTASVSTYTPTQLRHRESRCGIGVAADAHLPRRLQDGELGRVAALVRVVRPDRAAVRRLDVLGGRAHRHAQHPVVGLAIQVIHTLPRVEVLVQISVRAHRKAAAEAGGARFEVQSRAVSEAYHPTGGASTTSSLSAANIPPRVCPPRGSSPPSGGASTQHAPPSLRLTPAILYTHTGNALLPRPTALHHTDRAEAKR